MKNDKKPQIFFIIAASLFAVVLLPLLVPGDVPIFRDHTNYFLSAKKHLADSYGCWWSANYLGVPAYGDPQVGFWYPPHLLFKLLPFPVSYNVNLLLHFGIIYIFALLLGVRLFDRLGALFFAVGVTFCGTTLSLSEFNSNFSTFSYLFPILYVLVRSYQGDNWKTLLWLAPLSYLALTPGGLFFFVADYAVISAGLLFFVARRRLLVSKAMLVLGLSLLFLYLPLFYYFEFYTQAPLRRGYEAVTEFAMTGAKAEKLFWYAANSWEGFLAGKDTLYPFLYAGLTALVLFVMGVRRHWRLALLALVLAGISFGGLGWQLVNLPFALVKFRSAEKMLVYALTVFYLVAAAGYYRLKLPRALKVAVLILLFLELWLVNMPYWITVPYRDHLAAARFFSLPDGARTMSIVAADFSPNFNAPNFVAYSREALKYRFGLPAALYGQESFLGYSPAKLDSYFRLKEYWSDRARTAVEKTTILRNCGVAYVIGKISVLAPQAGWELLYRNEGEDLQVFNILDVKPRAYLVSTEAGERMQTLPDIQAPVAYVPVADLRVNAGEMAITCSSADKMWLVINSFYYPGMTITVDGAVREYRLAYELFPAVLLAPGDHTVAVAHKPTALLANTLLVAAGLLGWLLLFWRTIQPLDATMTCCGPTDPITKD